MSKNTATETLNAKSKNMTECFNAFLIAALEDMEARYSDKFERYQRAYFRNMTNLTDKNKNIQNWFKLTGKANLVLISLMDWFVSSVSEISDDNIQTYDKFIAEVNTYEDTYVYHVVNTVSSYDRLFGEQLRSYNPENNWIVSHIAGNLIKDGTKLPYDEDVAKLFNRFLKSLALVVANYVYFNKGNVTENDLFSALVNFGLDDDTYVQVNALLQEYEKKPETKRSPAKKAESDEKPEKKKGSDDEKPKKKPVAKKDNDSEKPKKKPTKKDDDSEKPKKKTAADEKKKASKKKPAKDEESESSVESDEESSVKPKKKSTKKKDDDSE